MPPEAERQLARSIYKEMIEIKSGYTTGATTPVAEAVAKRLKAAGFPAADIFVGGASPNKANLVVRFRGTGRRKPILLLAHTDVVEAKREDWTMDPFVLTEKDGYFYGRGVGDDKAQAAVWIANLIRYKREGFKPDRDIIVALTADEELSNSPHNGVRWLLQNHRALINAELAINEGGGGTLRNGKPVRNSVQLAEKLYQSYQLEVTDRGGHSAAPRRDNPIYRLSRALTRLADYEFPVRLNAVTRAYFERIRATEEGEVADAIRALLAGNLHERTLAPLTGNPNLNAQIRTTCVATVVEAGHAENALPQTARATVNCRVLPDQSVSDVEATRKLRSSRS